MIPKALQEVAQAMRNATVQLPSGSGDARVDAVRIVFWFAFRRQ